MPELPEVETIRRGIAPHITGKQVQQLIVRQPRLRWPVPAQLALTLPGQFIHGVRRRGKYLLLKADEGAVILHLGMSGSLRLMNKWKSPERHDHVDLVFTDNVCLRLRDPRRFGALLWTREHPEKHALLASLGPEPLGPDCNASYLYQRARGRKVAVKSFIMDHRTVAGVGNIYANEALFMAGIHPSRAAGRISLARYQRLVATIRQVLTESIERGGTTLRDFLDGDGQPGYYQLNLRVYGRNGQPCIHCGNTIRQIRQGQRASFYCSFCQR